jgi:hypothetical protein
MVIPECGVTKIVIPECGVTKMVIPEKPKA